MSVGNPGGGTAPSGVRQNWIDKLRAKGFSEDEIRLFETQMYDQPAVQRLTQRQDDAINELRNELSSMRSQFGSQQQHHPQQPSGGAIGDAWLDEHFSGDTEEARRARKLFAGFRDHLLQSVEQTLQSRLSETIQPIAGVVRQQEIQRHLETNKARLIDRYGEGVRDFFPDIERKFYDYLNRNQVVDLEATFRDLSPEDEQRLLRERLAGTGNNNAANTRKSAPVNPFDFDDLPGMDPSAGGKEGGADGAMDLDAIAAEAWEEAQSAVGLA